MSVLIDLLDHPDPCSLVALIAVLGWVGGYMVAGRADLHAWGYRLATIAFVGYGLFAMWKEEPVSAGQFLYVAIRALLGAGLGRGLSWIVLASVAFVYVNTVLRIRYALLLRAARRFEEQRARIQLTLMMARKNLEATAVTTVVDEPVPRPMTVIDQARQERGDYEQRLETLKELKEVSGLDDELLEEFEANELERYIRRMTDVLGYRQ